MGNKKFLIYLGEKARDAGKNVILTVPHGDCGLTPLMRDCDTRAVEFANAIKQSLDTREIKSSLFIVDFPRAILDGNRKESRSSEFRKKIDDALGDTSSEPILLDIHSSPKNAVKGIPRSYEIYLLDIFESEFLDELYQYLKSQDVSIFKLKGTPENDIIFNAFKEFGIVDSALIEINESIGKERLDMIAGHVATFIGELRLDSFYQYIKNRDKIPELQRASSLSTWFLGTYASKANLPDFKTCLNCKHGLHKGAFCKKYDAIVNQMEVCKEWNRKQGESDLKSKKDSFILANKRFLAYLRDKSEELNKPRNSLILPEGSVLFHGTGEEFQGNLDAQTTFDNMIWFADDPRIAQLYIPRAGLKAFIGINSLADPSKDRQIQIVQEKIGLHFDLATVEWDTIGRAKSFTIPRDWVKYSQENGENGRKTEIALRLENLGYVPENRIMQSWIFNFDGDRLLAPGEKAPGRLFIATTKRMMYIWVKAVGEASELEPQYHDLSGFASAENKGYDGVMIDDMAQSEKWGNFGHLSIGLFNHALKDLSVDVVPASYQEFEHDQRGTADLKWDQEPYFQNLFEKYSKE